MYIKNNFFFLFHFILIFESTLQHIEKAAATLWASEGCSNYSIFWSLALCHLKADPASWIFALATIIPFFYLSSGLLVFGQSSFALDLGCCFRFHLGPRLRWESQSCLSPWETFKGCWIRRVYRSYYKLSMS